MLATHHAKEDRLYVAADAADAISCRPDFVMLVAPAYLTNPIVSGDLDPALKLDKVARNITPPIFITSATTDKFSIGASHFALALRERHVPVEVHLYEKGGHAEGISDAPRQPMAGDGRRLAAPEENHHATCGKTMMPGKASFILRPPTA